MLKLTPLEETTVGRELIAQGIERGIEQGREKGIEQGEPMILVRLIARKFDVEPEVAFALLRPLRRQDFEMLSDLVLAAETFGEIRMWISGRTQRKNGSANVSG